MTDLPPALAARGLTLRLGRRTVVEAVDLDLPAGSLAVLLGANGAGKTTLLKACAGLMPAEAGSIAVDGLPLDGFSDRMRARRIAYLPQSHRPVFPFPAHEVVLMGRWPHSSPLRGYGEADRAVAFDMLRLVGAEALADRPYTRLSGGERQLVLIARALAQEARILILDEPETGLDVGHRQRLMDLLRRLADAGRAVLLSSHFPDNALRYADATILLARNRVLAAGQPSIVMTPKNLWELYGVEVVLPEFEAKCRDGLRENGVNIDP